jgi:hypothetical protein
VADRKRRFNRSDLDTLAEFVFDELAARQRGRSDCEKDWKEIDRQVAMKPDTSWKVDPQTGAMYPDVDWRSELELPFQSQTLETLTADVRRLMVPDTGSPFIAHAAVTDEYLERADFQALVAGDKNKVPSLIDQDNADKLTAGWLNFLHRQYDYWAHWDLVHVEALKYGDGVARVLAQTKQTVMETARGPIRRKERIPVLVPRSIWHTYFDPNYYKALNQGHMLGPSTIERQSTKWADLLKASEKGSSDPGVFDGGWIAGEVRSLEPDPEGYVEVVDFEGDAIVPRKTVRSVILPNIILTCAKGSGKPKVIRLRFRGVEFSTYIHVPYHREDLNTPYATSPLRKGMPLQKAATVLFNSLVDSGILNAQPPVKYDVEDANYSSTGGPRIRPRAIWPTMGAVETVKIGDVLALLQAFQEAKGQYYDVVGVNPPRLGAETKSHTTAFSKDVELARGTVRTVDYVNTVKSSTAVRALAMEYEIGRLVMGRRTDTVWIDEYGGYVELKREHLPDLAEFTWIGALAPSEEFAVQQRKNAALQMVVQLETLTRQGGQPPDADIAKIKRQVLRDAGYADPEEYFVAGKSAVPLGVAGATEVSPAAVGSADAVAALVETG